MKITYPIKFYIFDAIMSLLGLAGFGYAFISLVSVEKIHYLAVGFSGVLVIFYLIYFFFLLWNIQWINICGSDMEARNLFGVIKRMEFSQIQTAKIRNRSAWRVKVYQKKYPCIILSSQKQIILANIEDAYNHKKSHFIIFPSTFANLQKMQAAYKQATGNELDIK